jgi:hypothetical protein
MMMMKMNKISFLMLLLTLLAQRVQDMCLQEPQRHVMHLGFWHVLSNGKCCLPSLLPLSALSL